MSTITHERLRADALRQWQAHYDESIFRKIGMRAPEPVANQSILDYRRETDRLLKHLCLPQNHEFYKVQWRRLDTDVLDNLEPQHFKECEKEFNNPANLHPVKSAWSRAWMASAGFSTTMPLVRHHL